jgi:uncharacterized protein YegL
VTDKYYKYYILLSERKRIMRKMKENIDIVFLLDRSGSMRGTENDTIGGYNSYIKDFKDKTARITTVLFDDKYEMITKREFLNSVPELTNKEYFVRGSTALLDAIGDTIKFMEEAKAKKVIFIITTDGYENASRKYNKSQIKEMIEGHKDWEFMYIGADIDSYGEGMSLGIRKTNIANYEKSEKGISRMFRAMSMASESYCENASIKANWKEELDSYIEDNKKI